MKKLTILIGALLFASTGISQTKEEYLEQADKKYFSKEYSEAITFYTKAIELSPNDASIYSFRGHAKVEANDYNGAIADFTKSLKIEPNSAVYCFRGLAKNKNNDYKGAIIDFTKAFELDQSYSIAIYNRGLSKYYLKNYQEAIADFTKAIKIRSQSKSLEENADPYYYRALSKHHLGLGGVCTDLSKAKELGYTEAEEAILKYCN